MIECHKYPRSQTLETCRQVWLSYRVRPPYGAAESAVTAVCAAFQKRLSSEAFNVAITHWSEQGK